MRSYSNYNGSSVYETEYFVHDKPICLVLCAPT